MKCVHVMFKKMEVETFSVREGAVINIMFDDGGTKCMKYSTMLKNIDEDVRNIITKVQVYEKAQNKVLDANDILDGFVSIVIDNDEEVVEKMKSFLNRIRDDKSRLSSYGTHTGYIESLNKMQKKSMEFKLKGE